jgi:hypothetical protein
MMLIAIAMGVRNSFFMRSPDVFRKIASMFMELNGVLGVIDGGVCLSPVITPFREHDARPG